MNIIETAIMNEFFDNNMHDEHIEAKLKRAKQRKDNMRKRYRTRDIDADAEAQFKRRIFNRRARQDALQHAREAVKMQEFEEIDDIDILPAKEAGRNRLKWNIYSE